MPLFASWRVRQSGAAVALVLVAGMTAGCSLALMAPTVVEGRAFPVEHATQLRAAMSEEEVEAVVGIPLRRSSGAPLMWRYEFTRRIRECRLYVGPVPLQPARTERHVLDLTFGATGLERAIYTEVAPSRTSEQVVVRASAGAGGTRPR